MGERRTAVAGWLRKGRSPRIWLHVLAATIVGGLAGRQLNGGLVLALFGGWGAILAVVAVAAALFGLAGMVARSGGRGAWSALTVLVWVPATAVGIALATAADGGQVDASSWLPGLCGAGGAALATLLTWPGPSRVLASLGVVAAVVVLSAQWTAQHSADELRDGQARLGSTIRPLVAPLSGYVAAEPHLAEPGRSALAGEYVAAGAVPTRAGFDFVLITERAPDSVCGAPLWGVGTNRTAEQERSCTRVGQEWRRTSAHGVERARLVHGLLLRAVAPTDTDPAVLERALAAARPMDDPHYRHLLLGEKGAYIPELDGHG